MDPHNRAEMPSILVHTNFADEPTLAAGPLHAEWQFHTATDIYW